MQIISSTPKTLGLDKGKRFEEIEKQLKTKTHNPEEVAAQRDFIITVPGKVVELRQEIEQLDVSACSQQISCKNFKYLTKEL
jgi:hypothetical protein